MDFSTQSNPQQNPLYQKRASSVYQLQQPKNGPSSPTGGETFLQRQQRLYTPTGGQTVQRASTTQVAQPTQTQPQTAASSPVNSDGRVTPSPVPTPTQAPTATTKQTAPQVGQQAIQMGPAPGPAPYPQQPSGTVFQGYNLGTQPFSTYQGATFNENVPQAYQAGQLNQAPMATYSPDQFAQWQGPSQQAQEAQQNDLLQQMFASPHSMSDANVEQLKAQQRESALAMQRQLQGQLDQQAASLGRLGGGMNQANQRQLGLDTLSQVLAGNRDIALQKMQQDRLDELNLLGLSNEMLSGQMGRASTAYGQQLAGQQAQAQANLQGVQSQQNATQYGLQRDVAQESLNQAAVQSALQRAQMQQAIAEANAGQQWQQYQSQANAEQLGLQRGTAQAGINLDAANSALQSYQTDLDAYNTWQARALQDRLGTGSLALQQQQFGEGQRQFNVGSALDALRFLESQRQFNDNMGYNYNQLQQSGQNQLLQSILGLF